MATTPGIRRPVLARAAAGAAVAVGCLVLGAWALDPGFGKSAGVLAMTATTALGFVLAGASLLILTSGRPARARVAGLACAALATIIGLLSLIEDALGVDLGVDGRLFRQTTSDAHAPGRMAPLSAFTFLLTGLSLMLLYRDRRALIAQGLAVLALATSVLPFVGYLYGATALYRMGPFAPVNAPDAVTFIVLCMGALAACADMGVVGALAGKGPGGALARRLLPAAVTLPLLLGWARLAGQRAGLYGTEEGLALFVLANIVVFTALICRNAARVERLDAGQRAAEEALRRSEQQLRLVTDHASVYLAHCDREGRFLFVNEPYARRFGLRPEAIVGRRIPEVLGEAAYEPIKGHVELALTGRAVEYEVEVPYDRIGPRVIHCRYSPEMDEHGHVRGLVAVIEDVTDRKQSEECFRHVVEAAPHGMVVVGFDGTIVLANAQMEKTFAYAPGELIGRSIDLLVPQKLRDQHPALRAKFFANPQARAMGTTKELLGQRKDGSEVAVEIGLTPIRMGRGLFVLASVIDITQRHRSEEALRASEARLRELADAMPQIVWTARPDGRTDYWNRRWHEFSGLPPATDGNDDYWLAILHPDDRRRCLETWYQAVQSGEPYQIEYRFRDRRTGGYRWHLGRALPVKDGAGRVVRWYGTCTDIDDTKRLQNALRESKEHYRAVAETLPCLIWSNLPDGHNDFLNRRWLEYTGLTVEQSRGNGWAVVIHPDDLGRTLDRWARSLATGELYSIEYRLRRADGAYRWFLAQGLPLRDADGEIVHWFGACTDIEDQKCAEEALHHEVLQRQAAEAELRRARDGLEDTVRQRTTELVALNGRLQQSLAEKEVLLREVHHRVKNNLQVISSLLQLQARHADGPASAAMFRESQDRVRSMVLVHEQLYRAPDLARVDFAGYLHSLAASLFRNYRVDQSRVKLALDLQPVPLPIDAAVPCGLVVNELVSNALKHAFRDGRGGTITLGLEARDEQIVLSVCDDGVGLPSAIDFKRARSFGLSLVAALADQLHGVVRTNGEAGTQVEIIFPAAGQKPVKASA